MTKKKDSTESQSAFHYTELIEAAKEAFGDIEVIVTQRTGKQNRAMWLYLTNLAMELDNSGIDMREAIRVPIRPTKDNVKETMWDAIQRALWPDITSSTQLSTSQMIEIYDHMNRLLSDRFGVYVPWPSEDELMRKSYEDKD